MNGKEPYAPEHGPLNWESIRVFISAAEHSSVAGAAASLNTAPATIRRAIKDLEARIGLDLFRRTSQGLVLTDAGHDVLAHSRAMAQTAHAIKVIPHPKYQDEAGMVNISALQAISEDIISPQIGAFLNRYPNIALNLNVDTYVEDPASSDTDITVNYTTPNHPSLIPITVGHMHYVYFASRAYIEAHGEPMNLAECISHRALMMTTYTEILKAISPEVYAVAQAKKFNLYTNSAASIARACVSGAGIAALPSWCIEFDPRLVPLVNIPAVQMPIKMCALEHARERKAVRCVMDWFKELFSADRSIHFSPEFRPEDLIRDDIDELITVPTVPAV